MPPSSSARFPTLLRDSLRLQLQSRWRVAIKRLTEGTHMADADTSTRKNKTREHEETPPAGPHAKPELMNPDLTPGTGALPPTGNDGEENMQPTS
jgi:hypothetical protein